MIFILLLKWLHLEQFAYGDYESEVFFFFYHVKIFQNLHLKIFTLTLSNNSLFQEPFSIVVSLLSLS